MFAFDARKSAFVGKHGTLPVHENDPVSWRLAMLVDGECTKLGPVGAADKYGFTKQRYYQLRRLFLKEGSQALLKQKTGPRTNYRRTANIVCEVVRHRFLDPDASPEVITQKLKQAGSQISSSSVKRVIANFGLQKKTLQISSRNQARRDRDPSNKGQKTR